MAERPSLTMELLANRRAVRRLGLSGDGLIARAEALAEGLSPQDVKRLVHAGVWVRVRRGFYSPREYWDSLDGWRGRPLLVVRAAHRGVQRPHVVSHSSGAVVLDLPHLRVGDGLVHLTQYGAPRARVRNGVKHHHARFDSAEVLTVEGLPVLGLARTALDIAREQGFAAGVCAIDAARQREVSLSELASARAPMWHWPFVSVADEALAFSDPRAESIGESLSRILLDEAGLGPIQTQFEIHDGTRAARVDLRVGRHLVEFDGLVKLRPLDRGGVADRLPEEIVAAEKERQDWLCGFRLGMSRLTWADFWGPRRDVAKARLRREYNATTALWGTALDDLAPYVIERPVG